MSKLLNGKSDQCVCEKLEVLRRSSRLGGSSVSSNNAISTFDLLSKNDDFSRSNNCIQLLEEKRGAYKKKSRLTSTPNKKSKKADFKDSFSSSGNEGGSPDFKATNHRDSKNAKGKKSSKSFTPTKTNGNANGATTDCLSDDEPLKFRPNFKNNSISSYNSLPCSPCKSVTEATADQSCNGKSSDPANNRLKDYSEFLSQPQIYNKEKKTFLDYNEIVEIIEKNKCSSYLNENDPDLKILKGYHSPSHHEESDSDSLSSMDEVLTPRDAYEKQSHDYDYQLMTFEEMYNSDESSIILRFRRERCYEGSDWLLHLRVDKNEPFAKILPKLAKKWNSKVTDFVMILFVNDVILDDSPIILSDTPRKRRILPTHFIDCLKVKDPIGSNLSFKGFVALYMKNSSSGDRTVILHHEKKPLSIAMKEYSSVTGRELKTLEFRYKDVKINKTDTALYLKMSTENDVVVLDIVETRDK